MTRYIMCVENIEDEDWDEDEDEDWNEDEDEDWDISLGFDEGFNGYCLTIEKTHQPAQELEDFIFHNMRDAKGVSMKLSEVELKLAEFDIGLPRELAIELIRDGINEGYIQFLEEQNDYEKLRDFESFYHRVLNSPRSMWEPLGNLPTSWESLDSSKRAEKRKPLMGYCPVRCPAPNLTIDEVAKQLFSDLQKWAVQEGYDTSTLELWDCNKVQQAIAAGLSFGEHHIYQISWEEGPENWAILLLHGESFSVQQNGWVFEPATASVLGFARIE